MTDRQVVEASNSNKSNVEIIEIEFHANMEQPTNVNSDKDSSPKEHKQSTYKRIFKAFVDNAIRLMKERHSRIVHIHQSNRAGSSSWYVAMYPANNQGEIDSKYLFIFVFSEQSKQLNIPFEIVVRKDNNENHFKSFAEALDYVNTILENEQR